MFVTVYALPSVGYIMNSGGYKDLAEPRDAGHPIFQGSQSYRTLQFVVGSFGLESVLLTEESILRHLGVKVDFTLEQATKVQRGNRGIAILFL